MSSRSQSDSDLPRLKRALLALDTMQAKIAELERARLADERARTEPLAIIGMGCRFPGARSPELFWRMLEQGVEAVGEMPSTRWDVDAYYDPDPGAPGKVYTRRGAFLDDVDQFDPEFFGISRREAIHMDPQQRLFIEVAWEAMEDAALDIAGLAGSQTGVFVGAAANEYREILFADPAAIDIHSGTGASQGILAGRLSYLFDLRGPSLSIDTACSSGLVALHQACLSLRNRECDLALAGGVNLLLKPEFLIAACKMGLLSSDGRCRTFDARASGIALGEGCSVVVLKRLSDALAAGDHIAAVIRGSAINQDGHSAGLTAPNGAAQRAVIQAALANAGVSPHQISYVEAHGTGTVLGDPIEFAALAEVMAGRPSEAGRCALGSVKTNLGHTMTVAGLAGLMKVVLSLQHEAVPPHLHLERVNDHIALPGTPFVIPTERAPWPHGPAPRIAGVSSFGWSGTNAHVIVEEAPAQPARAHHHERPLHVLCLSARTEQAADDLGARYEQHLTGAAHASFADVCFTAGVGRAHFEHRRAVVAATAKEASDKLSALRTGQPRAGVVRGRARLEPPPGVVFLFSGQGSQYGGMGADLYETSPVFRDAIARCDEILRSSPEPSDVALSAVLSRATGMSALLDETEYTQPALFAMEYALAQLWRSWGVEPAAVFGHSIGEYVAACLAGVFSLEDGLRLAALRGKLMQRLPKDAGMAAVFADEARVREAIARHPDRLAIAGLNGPESIVVSGFRAELEGVLDSLAAQGVQFQRLNTSHAFHAPTVEPMLDAFERAASAIAYQPPRIPIVSCITGRVVAPDELCSAGYWRRHARDAVRFADGIRTLYDAGHSIFLEIGPQRHLIGMARPCLPDDAGVFLSSLRRSAPDWQNLIETVATLYVHGVRLDWAGFHHGHERRRVPLPTYPFQRARYWPAQAAARPAARAEAAYPHAWRHHIEWRPALRPAAERAASSPRGAGTWVIVRDSGEFGAELARQLETRGQRCVLIDPVEIACDAADAADTAAGDRVRAVLERHARSGGAPLCAVVYLDTATDGALVGAVAPVLHTALGLVQGLAALDGAERPRLWFVTRGAQAVARGDAPGSLSAAPLWGLGRVVALEHAELWGGLVDLAAGARAAPDDAARLLDELWSPSPEQQIALRGPERHVARLVPSPAPSAPAPAWSVRGDATYLVTGGLGGIGLAAAAWLVHGGARHLVLVGRREPGESARAAIAALERAGARVVVAACDVAREDQVTELFASVLSGMPPLRGVLHAAGVIEDGLLFTKQWSSFSRVLGPKLHGGWNLHVATRDLPLDFFVLFSSAAALLGSPGQGDYAAGNAFLDGLARRRRAEGLPATSIHWGAWTEVGMAASLDGRRDQWWRSRGMGGIAPSAGLAALADIVREHPVQIGVLPVDWPLFLRGFPGGNAPPFYAELAAAAQLAVPGDGPSRRVDRGAALHAALGHAPASERGALIEAFVATEVAGVLRLDGADSVDPQRGFVEMGMDSLMNLELRKRLQAGLGLAVPLPATALFDHPTVTALARHIAASVLAIATGEDVRPAPTAAPAASPGEDIAVVQVACRFPGGASDPESFWRLLRDGRSANHEVPADRWDVAAYYDPDPTAPGKMTTRRGAFLDHVDQFDAQFFGISPREADKIDPQQRLLLEVSWEALERGGLAPDRLAGTRTGVFFGISTSDYLMQQIKRGDAAALDNYTATGNGLCFAAGRVSYLLGLQGPSMSIDTACSSSLVAVHLACESLRKGECDVALAGGVNLILAPENSILLSRAGALAPDGRCKTFDALADGYGRGEGCGVVVLRRLGDAVRDGNTILAVVRGSAVSHDGRTSGLTVPNGVAQEALVREALAAARVEPQQISYVEAHGTGTPLGDPIEVRALGAVLGRGRSKRAPLALGSVKTNIGHLEAAAGIAGLIKVVLALHHQEIPAHLHFSQLNPQISLDDIPAEIPVRSTPWSAQGGLRIAGVSSFGLSGTNAHVILAEAPVRPAPSAVLERPLHVLCVSARTDAALAALAASYDEFLAAHPDVPLGDVAFTASTGRAHFHRRIALVAGSAAEAREQLSALHANPGGAGARDRRADARKPPKLAFVFPDGAALDPGLGRELYATQVSFRDAVDRADAVVRESRGAPLAPALFSSERAPESATDAELRSFVVAYAMASLWRAWGIEPAVVIGQGGGEIAAACVAGAFRLEDGVAVLARRAAAVSDLAVAVSRIALREPGTRALSCATGRELSPAVLGDAAWWRGEASTTVRAGDVARAALALGVQAALEIAPSGAPSAALGDVLVDRAVVQLPAAESRSSGWRSVLSSLAALYTMGAQVRWDEVERPYPRRIAALPTYPFQRRRHWLPDAPAHVRAVDRGAWMLAGRRVRSPLAAIQFENQLSSEWPRFLGDHRIAGRVVVPGAFYLAAVLSAAASAFGPGRRLLQDVAFPEALILRDRQTRLLHLQLVPRSVDEASFSAQSAAPDADPAAPWVVHATGTVKIGVVSAPASPLDGVTAPGLRAVQAQRTGEGRDATGFYQAIHDGGIELGPSFQWIERCWRCGRGLLGQLRSPQPSDGLEGNVPPAGLVDALLQLAGMALALERPELGTVLPVGAAGCWLDVRPGAPLWCHAELGADAGADGTITADLRVFTDDGQLAGEISGLAIRPAGRGVRSRTEAERAVFAGPDAPRPAPRPAAPRPDPTSAAFDSDLREWLSEQVARVLGLDSPRSLDHHQPLNELGIDSVMALDLRRGIEAELGLTIPLVQFLKGPTIAQLGDRITAERQRNSETEQSLSISIEEGQV